MDEFSKGKPTQSDIQEYSFSSFDNLEADKLGVRQVSEYELGSLEKGGLKATPEHQTIIKRERSHARETNFNIAPIVRQHRGIQEQEEYEREKRISEEVQRRVAELKAQAVEEGRAEGMEIGRQEVYEQTRSAAEEKIQLLTEMVAKVLPTQEEIIKNQKQEIYTMVRNISKWVILKELKEDGKYIERLLEKLIVELQAKDNLLILVNKKDFDHMPEVLKVVQEKLGELKNVRVEVDYDINDMGLTLESDNGIINGTLAEQFVSLDKLFESVGVSSDE